jgi:hexosaminidase
MTACSQDVSDFTIIPLPTSIQPQSGQFVFDDNTAIVLADPGNDELMDLARYATELLGIHLDLVLRVANEPAVAGTVNTIGLFLTGDSGDTGPEGYRLVVTDESVVLEAESTAGLFYGLHTLRQLPRVSTLQQPSSGGVEGWTIPAVIIEDQPRFTYRGMHLDVGRHFFPVEFIKRYIDLLAMYKMNTFHWHLTEDQGWRIEIEQYPRLTTVGAFRDETILEKNFDPYLGDGIPHGGYYTQDEIREIVSHAATRYVTVIPEIELPGHSLAALAAYPELGCTDGPFTVSTTWGVHEDIYCPNEETFAFLENVLTEVMGLFPSEYIHIGGDEAPKTRWEESPRAQEVIQNEGLADEHELQSYFVRRIEAFLSSHGRRLIGWDEILEGGLAPQATVMSWRGLSGGIEAAKQGHDVVMTPTSHAYFDYYQGDPDYEPLAIGGNLTLETVYSFEPIPDELTPAEAEFILGAQGNVWTEYIKTSDYIEYMVFPRLLAMAEVVWSPSKLRDWDSFVRRIDTELTWLDHLGVEYRVPHVRGLESDVLTLDDQVTVQLNTLLPSARIRYTNDSTEPVANSQIYEGTLELPVDEQGLTVTAKAFLPNGMASTPRAAHFKKTSLRPAESLATSELESGLRFRYYEGEVGAIGELSDLTPSREGVSGRLGTDQVERDEQFGLWFEGFIEIPESGVYTFHMASDDGSGLIIGDATVIDNDGLHNLVWRSGMIALERGYHPIAVLYFQAGGGKGLQLLVQRPGVDRRIDPEAWLSHRR